VLVPAIESSSTNIHVLCTGGIHNGRVKIPLYLYQRRFKVFRSQTRMRREAQSDEDREVVGITYPQQN